MASSSGRIAAHVWSRPAGGTYEAATFLGKFRGGFGPATVTANIAS